MKKLVTLICCIALTGFLRSQDKLEMGVEARYTIFFTNPDSDATPPLVSAETGDIVQSVNFAYFGPKISNAMAAIASSTANISETHQFAKEPEIE